MAGYSGTPLVKKLGYTPEVQVLVEGAPPAFREALGPAIPLVDAAPAPLRAAHLFTTSRATLEARLTAWRAQLDPAGAIWVSWPKKAAKVPTDITEDAIRDVALPLGLVDIKVCAVDDVWSGLKLVIRKTLR